MVPGADTLCPRPRNASKRGLLVDIKLTVSV